MGRYSFIGNPTLKALPVGHFGLNGESKTVVGFSEQKLLFGASSRYITASVDLMLLEQQAQRAVLLPCRKKIFFEI